MNRQLFTILCIAIINPCVFINPISAQRKIMVRFSPLLERNGNLMSGSVLEAEKRYEKKSPLARLNMGDSKHTLK